jgi:hypothetical protein
MGRGKNEEEPVGLKEVEVGKVYRLIYTDLIGEITRYDTANSFRCIAKGDEIIQTDFPVFEYHSRLDSVIAIMNFTRIGEDEILEAFRRIGLQITDFTTKLRTEGGHEYIYLYVELAGKKSNANEDLAKEIHQYLYSNNPDYKMLADSFAYIPIKLELLPKNTFVNYLETRNGAFPKVCRIGISDDEFERLISSKLCK